LNKMSGQIYNKKIKRTIIWNGESTSLAIPSTWDDIYSTSNKAKGNELIVSRLSLSLSVKAIDGSWGQPIMFIFIRTKYICTVRRIRVGLIA